MVWWAGVTSPSVVYSDVLLKLSKGRLYEHEYVTDQLEFPRYKV